MIKILIILIIPSLFSSILLARIHVFSQNDPVDPDHPDHPRSIHFNLPDDHIAVIPLSYRYHTAFISLGEAV